MIPSSQQFICYLSVRTNQTGLSQNDNNNNNKYITTLFFFYIDSRDWINVLLGSNKRVPSVVGEVLPHSNRTVRHVQLLLVLFGRLCVRAIIHDIRAARDDREEY